MYGGLDTTKSYLLSWILSISIFMKLILFCKWCIFALYLAILRAFLLISIAVPLQSVLFLITEIIIQPDPVPTSKILFDEPRSIFFKTSSTIISVSGLGINTSLLT